jgi:hypothetical protein
MKFKKTYHWQRIKDDMVIHGKVQTREVFIAGLLLDPQDSLEVINHSPDGFAWGYPGSGPSQLALALLMAVGLKKSLAIRLHHDFKNDVIAKIPMEDDFRMEVKAVRNWCNAQEKKNADLRELLKDE